MTLKQMGWVWVVAAGALVGQTAGQCSIDISDSAVHLDVPWPSVSSLSTDGDHLAIGEISGGVAVYQRLAGGWAPQQKLGGGSQVAVDAQWVVAGSGGGVQIYRLVAGQWTESQAIVGEPGEIFGVPVALNGARFLVGRTVGRLYEFDPETEQWALAATFPHNALAVALQGDLAAVGDSISAQVYVYQRTTDGTWTALPVLTPPAGSVQFGFSLAFHGDDLLIADPGFDDYRGVVYVYSRTGDEYLNVATLAPASLAAGSRFGTALAVSGNVAVVTAPYGDTGTESPLYPFKHAASGWMELPSIDVAAWRAGALVALSGGQLAVSDSAGVVHFSAGISDFDGNGALDRCDAQAGTYQDLDCDNVPDVSPLDREPAVDCDGDGQLDGCGPFVDCNTNGVPDSCELVNALTPDCNGNGRPDWCDLHAAIPSSSDCNYNGIPDECDIASGASLDCNADGLPDECDPSDCNGNNVPDECELANGSLHDCNLDRVPDECECQVRTGCTYLHFTDVSAEAGLTGVRSDRDPDWFSQSHWAGGGVAADVNNDGWQDIFFIAGLNRDVLYLNNGDGTFRDVSEAWGILPGTTFGASVADYNNDGTLDLLVSAAADAEHAACRLYRNNGNETFTDVAAASGLELAGTLYSTAWGDYDADGDLDLATVEYVTGPSRVYRNKGDGTFAEVTALLGISPSRFLLFGGTSVRFADMDGDRLLDLIMMRNYRPPLYLGNVGGGTFEDRSAQVRRLYGAYGFAVCDFDEDGDFDLHIPSQCVRNDGSAFVPILDDGAAEGGTLMAMTASDIDHDTRPDLVITSKYDGHSVSRNIAEPGASIAFTDLRQCSNFDVDVSGRGLALIDYDNDGDQDVLLFPQEDGNVPGPLTLLRNDLSGPDTNWIRIFLDTSGASDIPPNGIGSVVKVRLGDGPDARTLMNFIDGGSNYLSQSELSAHFGLAGATNIDEITVEWTNGTTTTLTDVPANQTLTIAAPATTCPADLDRNAAVDVFDLLLFIDRWFAGDANYANTGSTDIFDLLAYLDAWFTGC